MFQHVLPLPAKRMGHTTHHASVTAVRVAMLRLQVVQSLLQHQADIQGEAIKGCRGDQSCSAPGDNVANEVGAGDGQGG